MFYKKPTLSNAGFTLLEIALVLFILLVIAGMALPMTAGLIAQERFKAQVKALQDYAVTARKLAVTEGRPYEIILNTGGFTLERVAAGEKKKEDTVASVKLARGVTYLVQYWGEKELGKPAGESWIFRPDGICEPIRVHFQGRDGWIEFAFNPLTAAPRDESDHFQ